MTSTRTAKKISNRLRRLRLALNNNFARASRSCLYFFPLLHDYDVKLPNFTFFGGREHKTSISFCFCELRYSTLEFNSRKIANIWEIKGVGIRAMKFQIARIHFLGDVFCCRCRRRCLSPLITRIYHWYFKHTLFLVISIGNSMICSDIWQKYHEWYFKIVIPNFTSR